ncbi:winged helix-turn-helix domain-containing protein [Nitrosomonas sp. Nm33]|uniref:winged helix-turn-helix domain-containing protein n=2 Tax=Nitrosomonas sp. Nm33 TaxID=133724 RepID=UPI00089478FA|nr:winged helix-turn-helix domain-containing protein [Nitrosomonas sp. Nm33]SDY85261.1 Winged helix-turn helix [Nitrosomonas sp. Nm33]SDY96661.1 Winged helix-turn helix [Nitrosomonas sp. Nm33]SDZ18494.1 Winged helix-turn helix [Nitrosomonas sp. Nm33]
MARKASGIDQLVTARELLRTAKTAEELRAAQAVLLPLELGMSLEETAKAIGRSIRWTCSMRTRYCRVARCEEEAPRTKRALRNRAIATLEQEAQILDEVLAGAARGGVVVVPPLKEKIEERLGKRVALSTIYRMLARHGWRKLAPDSAHPQGDAALREDWKKNLRSG